MKFKVIELTKDNEEQYVKQVAELEDSVLEAMEKNGQVGQFFTTGEEDIAQYVESEENTVYVATSDEDRVIAATYITQGQFPFTYNDITKYFKYGENYKKYVKGLYDSIAEYKKDMLDAYNLKLQAFKYAKEKLLAGFPQYNTITDFLAHELQEEGNHFHEKSQLRELINRYMSEYVVNSSDGKSNEALYERFYWTTSDDIAKEFGKEVSVSDEIKDYEEQLNQEYEQIIQNSSLVIHEEPDFDESEYYTANTSNSVEIDTYITDPNKRHAGLARILVFEGIKKHIEAHFSDPENEEIFLCSTLHRKNLSSKYVSEFFGLKDSLFVKRRDGRDREVHICKIGREKANEYLSSMQKKLAVLYGYNPENIRIELAEQARILEEQLEYEREENDRIRKVRKESKYYTGKIDPNTSKINKIRKLNNKLIGIRKQMNQEKNAEER